MNPTVKPSPRTWGLEAQDDGFVYLHGEPMVLPPREQAVLHLLLREWPKVVSKDQFAQQVWPGLAMSDESLAQSMAQLRQRLLASDIDVGIQSVYRRGYRLVLPKALGTTKSPAIAATRLQYDAMAAPQQVATLTYARRLLQQRTPASLQLAKHLLSDLTTQAPEYVAAKLALAECLAYTLSGGLELSRSLVEQGLHLLTQVRQLAPQSPGLQAETAHLLDCGWRFDEAAEWHRQARRDVPNEWSTHYYLGWHLLATGRSHEAVRSLRMAQQLSPFTNNITILLARALANCGEGGQSLMLARQMHEREPDNPKLRVYLLGCEAFVHPAPEMADQARALLDSHRAWAYAGSSLSYVLARCGAPQEAARMVDAVENEHAGIRINYLTTLLLLNRLEQARQWVLDAMKLGCGQFPVLWHVEENTAAHTLPEFAQVLPLLPSCKVDPLG